MIWNKYPLFVFSSFVECYKCWVWFRGISRAWEAIEVLGWIRGLPKQCESGFVFWLGMSTLSDGNQQIKYNNVKGVMFTTTC